MWTDPKRGVSYQTIRGCRITDLHLISVSTSQVIFPFLFFRYQIISYRGLLASITGLSSYCLRQSSKWQKILLQIFHMNRRHHKFSTPTQSLPMHCHSSVYSAIGHILCTSSVYLRVLTIELTHQYTLIHMEMMKTRHMKTTRIRNNGKKGHFVITS